MSHQAVNWAIEQKAGGPAPKATLWSIANYANEDWCSWPSQHTIGAESEQSRDTVRRQVAHLEAVSLVRCIPMRYAGRRSGNFYILKPSPYFGKSVAEIEPLLPRGYTPLVSGDEVDSSQSDLENDALNCGVVLDDDAANDALNDALNDAALVRHQVNPGTLEPGKIDDDSCSRVSPINEAFVLTKEIAVIAGITDHDAWPPGWSTATHRVEAFLREGYLPDDLRNGARQAMANKRDGPPHSIEYFSRPWAKARAQREAPVPQPQKGSPHASTGKTRSRADGARASGDAGKAPFGWLSVPQRS